MKTKRILAAAALLATPTLANAATDGSLGATSTGSFSVNLTLNAQPTSQVQILGLDDYEFGSVTAIEGLPPLAQNFCLNRNDAGLVQVTMSQPNNQGVVFELFGSAGGRLQVLAEIEVSNGQGAILFPNRSREVRQTPGCTASSGFGPFGPAHQLSIRPVLGQGATPDGQYSGTFTILISPL